MQLDGFLESSARKFPGKTALVCGDQRLTYLQVEERANRLAHALLAGGVARGDRVVVWLENGVEAVVSIFAILKAGGVFCLVNPGVKPEKLGYIISNCRAKGLITGQAVPDSIRQCAVWSGKEDGGSPRPPGNRCIDVDLAALIYTSGSTGKPKGVMLTHLNMVTAANSITTYLENRADDVILNALPLSFDYGLYQVLMGFLFGGTVVLMKSFALTYVVLETLMREQVTGFPIVPSVAAMLLEMDLARYRFPALRYITSTGAVFPQPHLVRLRAAFPGVRIYSMYGLTECKRVSYLPPDQLDVRPTSVGRGMPNQEIYLVDEEGRRLAPGRQGQLVVRGSHVMKGYWDSPEETEAVLKPGPLPGEKVLYSGDVFRTDEEGYFYFVGRGDDMIKVGAHRVYPREIEDVLHAMPEVAEAVVWPAPDPLLGQSIQAAVRLKEGARVTPQDVLFFCSKRLESYLVPKTVEFREELPKTATGKLSRRPSPGSFSRSALDIDAAAVARSLEETIRRQVRDQLRRRGVVVGLSGGVDSSVVAALAVRSLGKERVLGLLMPESDSSPDSLRFGRLVAEQLGVEYRVEDITPILTAAGCYSRRDEAVRSLIPEFGPGWLFKIAMQESPEEDSYVVYNLLARAPDLTERQVRLTYEAFQGIVAATGFKQRTRKMLEYYWADRMRYAVAGTPNRQEYDQGFFVKNGDGAADLKPIARLYKSQVYSLAEHLNLPDEVRLRPPTTDTYPLSQTQGELFFSVPWDVMDLCLFGKDHGAAAEEVAEAAGMTDAQVRRVFRLIDTQRRAALYLRAEPLLAE